MLKKIYEGQSAARVYMNDALRSFSVRGATLDVGGARSPDYFSYLAVASDVHVDIVDGKMSAIDFEKDPLPHPSNTYDTVLLCNVLEHIFNHSFVVRETNRVLKPHGVLVGFVPFLFQVHPDPHDFFRYTEEALERLLADAGFVDRVVRPVGAGPFMVGCNTVIQGLPRILRPTWFIVNYALDRLFMLRASGEATRRFPLGYVFSGRKCG